MGDSQVVSTPAPRRSRKKAATRAPAPAAPAKTPPPEPEWDMAPSRHIARINKRTGKEVPGPIAPEELLVHAHRDQHPVEVLAQFVGARLIQLTGREGAVETALKTVNSLGATAAGLLGSAVGSPAVEETAKRLMGVVHRDVYFKFRET